MTRSSVLLCAVFLALSGLGGALLIARLWRTGGSGDTLRNDGSVKELAFSAGLEERLQALEATMRDLAPSKAGAPQLPMEAPDPLGSAEGADPVGQRLATLESRVKELEDMVNSLREDPLRRAYDYLASSSAPLRRQGIKLLRKVARYDPESRQAIRALLQDPDASVRKESLQALADVGDREGFPQIAGVLADTSPDVRKEAIETIGKLFRESGGGDALLAARSVSERLSDPDPGVRVVAADTLGDLKVSESTPALLKALEDTALGVRQRAIASLDKIGDPTAAPALQAMYDQGAGDDALTIALALMKLGRKEAFQREVQRLSQQALTAASDEARLGAIRLLGKHAGKANRGVFQQAMGDASPRVRQEAESILKDLEEE